MKVIWCWKCKAEVPMMSEDEYAIAHKLYSESFGVSAFHKTKAERFRPLLDYYKELTGVEETNPNTVMHHRLSLNGSVCPKCEKPYRTKDATVCLECGEKRSEDSNPRRDKRS